MKTCPYCGKAFPNEAPICPIDHTRLESDGRTPNATAEVRADVESTCAIDQPACENDAPKQCSESGVQIKATRRFRPYTIMAIYGAILLGVMPFLVARFIPHDPLAGMLLLIPAYQLISLPKVVYLLPNDFYPSDTWVFIVAIILNPLLGAILFVFLGKFLQLITQAFSTKGDHEEQRTAKWD